MLILRLLLLVWMLQVVFGLFLLVSPAAQWWLGGLGSLVLCVTQALTVTLVVVPQSFMLWDTADAEIKDLSVEITELKGSPFIKPGTALHASLTARDFFLISTSRYIRLHFFQTSPDFSPCVSCG